MKSGYALALVVFIIVLAWVFQGEWKRQAKILPVAVDAREDSSWSEASQAVASLREELAQMQNQLAWMVKQQAHRPPPDSSATAVADLREELTQMQNQLARVVKQQAHRPPPDSSATVVQPQAGERNAREQDSGDDAQTRLQMDAQEREAQEQERIEQVVAYLSDSFHREPYDDGWTAQIEADIAKDFKTDDWDGNALAEASCSSTLCRMVVAHEDLNAAGSFVTRMGTLQAFANTEGFYQRITLADGTPATVVYIARQGYRLPAMSSP